MDTLGAAAEAVWQAVAPTVPGFSVEVLEQIDSTNTELMRRARAGRPEPVLLVARSQTAGRGRLGRAWASAPGDSLTFSVGLTLSPPDWAGLSLAVGASLAEGLGVSVRLKWPNDLWLDDRKLAGVLIETASFGDGAGAARYAVVGVGVNIAPRTADGLSTPPAWVREVQPGATDASTLARVAPPLVDTLLAFQRFGFAPFQARFGARDALRDREVVLSDGQRGTAHGVTDRGALLVHTAAGMQAVTSAEVSVRPVA